MTKPPPHETTTSTHQTTASTHGNTALSNTHRIPAPDIPLSPSSLAKFKVNSQTQMATGVLRPRTPEVRKPRRDEWFSTLRHISECDIYNMYEANDVQYMVSPDVAHIFGEASPERYMVPWIAHETKEVYFWPVSTDSSNSWVSSAMNAVEEAINCWRRICSNKVTKAYDLFEPVEPPPPPQPINDSDLEDLLFRAWKGRIIESSEHPAVKRLLCA